MITPKLLEIDKALIEAHKKLIKEFGNVNPVILLVKKDYSQIYMALVFRDNSEKELIREKIKTFIANQEILGYFFFSDSIITKMNTKDNSVSSTQEALVHYLYTPSEKKGVFIIHEGKKIIEEVVLSKEENKASNSEWDLWGKGIDINSKVNKTYQDFKKNNPEKYKGV